MSRWNRWIYWLPLRFRSLFRASQVDAELDEELRDHLERETHALLAKGLIPEEARRMALMALGGLDQQKEACRDARQTQTVEHLVRDLQFGARLLRRSPGFTSVAILSLALGVGANTAIFQLLDAIRLRSLPVRDPQELAEIRIQGGHGGLGVTNGFGAEMTYPLWEQVREHQEGFAGVFAWGSTGFIVGRGANSRFVRGLWVSGEMFPTLQLVPGRGRLLTTDDDRRGCGTRTVVLSHSFWQSYFGGADSAIGATLSILGRPVEVIGVTPPDFFGLETGQSFDVALPLCAAATWNRSFDARHVWWLTVMGRLRNGWSVARASERLHAISPGILEATMPTGYDAATASREKYRNFSLSAEPASAGISQLRANYERPLWLLLAITGLVLLIACANIANLMLARAGAREKEIAVRVAIGASRRRIVGQLLSESILLAAVGGVLGAAVASALSRGLVSFLGTENDTLLLDIAFDWRVFAFTVAVALITCVVFGLAPAIRAARIAPGAAMNARGTTAGRERFLGRRLLLVTQVAVSLVLLVAASLFVRSFRNLILLDTGLRRDGVVFAFMADMPDGKSPGGREAAVHAMHTALLERIRAIPQVEAAAISTQFPLNGASWTQGVRLPESEGRGSSKFTYVSSDYFRTMDIRMRAGRDISEFDTATSRKVLVASETFVSRFFGGTPGGAIGRQVRTIAEPNYPETVYEVIGVVADTKYANLRDDIPAIAYVPITQHPSLRSVKGLVFRTSAPLAPVFAEIRRQVAVVNPDIMIAFKVFETQIRESLIRERLMAWLTGFFGSLAVLIATIGLYGVISYMVVSRRGEIGIRLALGASPPRVVRLMLRETTVLVAIGLAAGAVLSIPVTRSAAVLLFGLSPHDLPTLAAAAAALALTAGLAGYLPARRAARVDPMIALRSE